MGSWLNDIIKNSINRIFEYPTVQEYCFLYLYDKAKLAIIDVDDLQGEEEILAAKGFKNISPDREELLIIEKKTYKKIAHYKDDKYKLIGICLAAGNASIAYNHLKNFINNSNSLESFLVQKFFTEFSQDFLEQLKYDVRDNSSIKILKYIYFDQYENEIGNLITELSKKELETVDLIVLYELQSHFSKQVTQKTTYKNLTPRGLIIEVLENFENAVIKITDPKERYGGKTANPKKTPKIVISIEDEYDVQDILYVVLKSVFPKIKYENPLAKFGGRSTRLDFVLMEEGVIIEVKQINENERNDKKFIDQMKIDLESYHVLDYLNELIFFIYAPKAIQDLDNFMELEGERTIQGKTFNVTVVVVK